MSATVLSGIHILTCLSFTRTNYIDRDTDTQKKLADLLHVSQGVEPGENQAGDTTTATIAASQNVG